jgi:polo-like kinase 1
MKSTASMPATASVAPPVVAAAASSSTSAQSSLVVPDVVEDRREDGAGGVLVRRYSRGKLLGKGGFAKCFAFINQENGKTLAGKCVSKESLVKHKAKQKVCLAPPTVAIALAYTIRQTLPSTLQLMSEIKIHRSLNHRQVVGFESFFEDRNNVYIMLEICPNQVRLVVWQPKQYPH